MRLAPGSMLILTVGDYGDLAPHKGEAYASTWQVRTWPAKKRA